MNKLLILSTLLVLCFVRCFGDRTINIPIVKEMMKSMKQEYTFIKHSKVYFQNGPNTLMIRYDVKEDTKEREKEACFQATKEWLLEGENLETIEAYLDVGHLKEINIIIATEFISDWYIGYYYESGTYGYQDSRYWDEEHVDDFKTWTHDVIDCREDE